MASASSSAPFFGIREEDPNQIKQPAQQHQSASSTPTSSTPPSTTAAPQKKKRNLPGTPNPDAEVIALSPKSLLATNRFICEVCNKGFQREQNLQLHRRGHNLPWKLKQKTTKEVRKKVYLCPEPTCVHHDPSRALGDLTGIKKHYCRKHGEKKWKCDKCSKRYAVQSDWKAHSKTCGTREYRCDCGTLFSRRDSFITHRAFCDALAQESARHPTGLNTLGGHLYSSTNMGLGLSQVGTQMSSPSTDLLRLSGATGTQFDHLLSQASNQAASSIRPPPSQSTSSSLFLPTDQDSQSHLGLMHNSNKPFHGLMQLPGLHGLQGNTSPSNAAAGFFNLGFFANTSINTSTSMNTSSNSNNAHLMASSGLILQDQFGNPKIGHHESGTTLFSGNIMGSNMSSISPTLNYGSSIANEPIFPQMSATALLQKAAQMGATTSNNNASYLRSGFRASSPPPGAKPEMPISLSSNFRGSGSFGDGGGESMKLQMENDANLQDLVNSLATAGSSLFGSNASRSSTSHGRESGYGGFNLGRMSMEHLQHRQGMHNAMEEAKLHQNKLAVSNVGGSDGMTRDFLGVGGTITGMAEGMQQRDHHHHLGMDISSFESEMTSGASGSRTFGSSNLQ